MSTISSSSTDPEIWDAYDDNASYEEDVSRTKALAFITACRIILRRRPESTSRDGQGSVSFESIREEMDSARAWLAGHPASSSGRSSRYSDFSNFRDC